MYLTTKALVLREVRFKEADKMLTVLTPTEGKLSVRARGALRKGSRFGAAAQQLCYSEMTLFGNAGRWSLNEARTLEQFLPLRADLGLLALGSYFAELLETVSDMDEPDPALLQLGLNSLYALGRGSGRRSTSKRASSCGCWPWPASGRGWTPARSAAKSRRRRCFPCAAASSTAGAARPGPRASPSR
ncbi:MAG: DNA repair protein RecO [Oscillospiraceae bacterium]|nr:DNA repair protein RecO [Oscillospiraceae bacterium]